MMLFRLIALFALALSTPAIAQAPAGGPTAVLGAMEVEVESLGRLLEDPETTVVAGIPFVAGRLDGRPVVLARVGIGKVNAAMVTTLLLDRFQPQEILFTGIAGALSPELRTGDIVIATRTAQHDLGSLTAAGMERWGARPASDTTANPVFFPADSLLLRVATAAGQGLALAPLEDRRGGPKPRVTTGTVLTGDVFLQSSGHAKALREDLGGDAVEMEGAAVAQVAWQWGRVPVLVIRSISDGADEAAPESYAAFREVAAANSAALVRAILAALPPR